MLPFILKRNEVVIMFIPANEDFRDELNRFSPDLNYGLLNVDIGVLFPFRNQDEFLCDFMLADFDILSIKNTLDELKHNYQPYTDFVLDHRYRNHDWITLSRKIGRKKSRIGYPLISPIDEINKYKTFVLRLNNQFYFYFPIYVNLSEKTPFSSFQIRVHGFDDNKTVGIDFIVFEPMSDHGLRQHTYITDHSLFDVDQHVIRLHAAQGSEECRSIAFQPIIKLFAYA